MKSKQPDSEYIFNPAYSDSIFQENSLNEEQKQAEQKDFAEWVQIKVKEMTETNEER